MQDLFQNYNPILQSFIAGIFTWLLTGLGSLFIFIKKDFSQKLFDAMLGFAGGVMIAASFWSLLEPAIEMSSHLNNLSWFPAFLGFFLGALFLRLVDKILPHLHMGFSNQELEGIRTSWQRSVLLVLAITIHNIPEGLAIGVAIGAAYLNLPDATLLGAIALTFGIGIQNIPEGFAVSISLYREKISRFNSYFWGHMSGIVEPIASVFGAMAVIWLRSLLPYALSFAAGAMIFVVVEEVIPESQRNGNTDLSTTGTIIGFLTMMILDVSFG